MPSSKIRVCLSLSLDDDKHLNDYAARLGTSRTYAAIHAIMNPCDEVCPPTNKIESTARVNIQLQLPVPHHELLVELSKKWNVSVPNAVRRALGLPLRSPGRRPEMYMQIAPGGLAATPLYAKKPSQVAFVPRMIIEEWIASHKDAPASDKKRWGKLLKDYFADKLGHGDELKEKMRAAGIEVPS